jgi:hypothetical protein
MQRTLNSLRLAVKQNSHSVFEGTFMRKFIAQFITVLMLASPAAWGQQVATAASQESAEMKQEIEQLKKQLAAMEQRLAAQEKSIQAAEPSKAADSATVAVADLQAQVKDIDQRVAKNEKHTALDRLKWSGDFRFQTYSYTAHVPTYYNGMQMQNYMVKTLFMVSPTSMGGLGIQFDPNMLGQLTTAQLTGMLNGAVQQNYAQYQYFTNNLSYQQLQQAMGAFPPSMQQGLINLLQPATLVNGYNSNNKIMYTNRLRLNFDSQLAENVSVTARLSMYKVFGDSTGVQVFDGQPTSMAIDGTTTRVPNSDILRVERAYFTWNNIGGIPLYLSIGRRPSTEGPPMNYRLDEPRGGTPAGSLIDYQFDGITVGYHIGEKTTLRACYGLGYESGYGNGQVLNPNFALKDVHFFGGNFDLYSTDKTFVQFTLARAWNVTDGFNGQVVLPSNPITGEPVLAPVIMRYTPSANLGGINLYGLTLTKRLKQMDLYSTFNWSSTRPNGQSSAFGGLMSDPFETPVNHDGHMILLGARYSFPQDDNRTKIGFEFNQGSKYWFNFSQAEDNILAPKTATRGEAYEAYVTHRINDHFIFNADYLRYNYTYSGSGWHVQAPKLLNSMPLLGFPTYDNANVFTVGLTARF